MASYIARSAACSTSLRIAVGLTLAAHGGQKLFGWFKGPGRAGVAALLESLGFRHGRPYAWIGGAAEFVGGLLHGRAYAWMAGPSRR